MSSETVKLTVRMPKSLHAALRRRASQSHRSMNREIIDTLRQGLATEARSAEIDPYHAVMSLLQSLGLWSPDDVSLSSSTLPTDHAALRAAIGQVPPLSDLILEDRGPR